MLFEDEIFNITCINKVIFYNMRASDKFEGNLSYYEMMYYIDGESTVTFNGQTYQMQPGCILYLPKGIANNKDYTVTVKKEVSLYNIYFDTTDPMPDHPVKLQAKWGESKFLFEKLYRTWFSKKENYYYKSIRYAYRIFELVRMQQLLYGDSNRLSKLAPSEEYLSAHYCDHKFDYAELVRLSGLSYSYFKKLFIEKYGVSPVRRVNQLKIHYACELLETGRFAVGEIAEMCGFENTYYFSTVFKNHFGVSPKNYQKNKNTME